MEKTQSYTPEQTTQVVQEYLAGVSVKAIAEQLGKSTNSVIAKLAKEGVYKPKDTVKATRVTKAMLIAAIAVKFRVSEESLESLEKATKQTLEILAS